MPIDDYENVLVSKIWSFGQAGCHMYVGLLEIEDTRGNFKASM